MLCPSINKITSLDRLACKPSHLPGGLSDGRPDDIRLDAPGLRGGDKARAIVRLGCARWMTSLQVEGGYGCSTVVLRLCCGCATVVLRLCCGCAAVVLRLCCGCAMVVLRLLV